MKQGRCRAHSAPVPGPAITCAECSAFPQGSRQLCRALAQYLAQQLAGYARLVTRRADLEQDVAEVRHAPLPHIQVQRLRLGPGAPGAQQLRRARLVDLRLLPVFTQRS